MFDDVKEAGREALDKGKQVAKAAVDTIKQEVENSDLTPAGLAEKVRTVAKEATNTVKEEAKKANLVPGRSDQQGGETAKGGRKATTSFGTGANLGATQAQPAPPTPGQTTTGPNAGGMPGTQVKGQTDKVNVEEPELAKR